MLEVVLLFALVSGTYRSVRLRRWLDFAGSVAGLYLVAADTANVIASSHRDLHPLHVFIFTFLGPSMWHLRGDGALPLPPFLHGPLWLRAARILLCAAVAWRCTREATRTNPLLPRNRSLQWMATPFVGAAVLDAAEGLLVVFGRYVAAL